MAVYLSPVGLAAAPVANQLSVLATFKERLCHCYSVNATTQPSSTVTYTTGTPKFNGTTVFVPITAQISITTPNSACGCNPNVQVFSERFDAAFQGQTALPTAVTVDVVGTHRFGSCVNACGIASTYTINESLTITITPGAAPAATSVQSETQIAAASAKTKTSAA